jgi:hypothetical protein
MDEIGGRLDTAIGHATIAQAVFAQKQRKAKRVAESKNRNAINQALDEALDAQAAWRVAVAAAERIKTTYESIQTRHETLVAAVTRADAGVTKSEVDLIETRATRLGNDVLERTEKLQAAATRPSHDDDVISDALGKERRKAQRLAPNESDAILAEADKADDREALAAKLGISLTDDAPVAPASSDRLARARLAGPTETPINLAESGDKNKAPVNREDKKPS